MLGPAAFEVAVAWHDDVVVLGVTGALDMVTAPQLTESILTTLTNSPRSIVVDLAGVEFLASAGMTVLVAANEKVAEQARSASSPTGPQPGDRCGWSESTTC